MGYKRCFDDEEYHQQLSFKQQKQVDHNNKLTSFTGEVQCFDNISGGPDKSQYNEQHEVPIMVGNESKSGAPLPSSSFFHEGSEFNYQTKTFGHPEHICSSSFMDRFPRKQVPIGPNHQANVPDWVPLKKSDSGFDTEDTEIMKGICVISVSDSAWDLDKVGDGRKECNCLDVGSVTCVRTHVLEGREKLKNEIGLESFVGLGFDDMGEEVAHKWTEEEEHCFHEVVYTNPSSFGINFWHMLAAELPARSRSEIVSYYFNVFMLRRRAAQNRSDALDIDSDDDDEWHGRNKEDSLDIVNIEDEDDESLTAVDDGDDDNGDDDDDGDEDDDNDSDSDDGDLGGSLENTTKTDENFANNLLVNFGENFDGQDDSCLSFEFHHQNMMDSVEGNDSYGSKGGHGYILDNDNNDKYMRGYEFLPTCNMIEEIFGLESYEKDKNDY